MKKNQRSRQLSSFQYLNHGGCLVLDIWSSYFIVGHIAVYLSTYTSVVFRFAGRRKKQGEFLSKHLKLANYQITSGGCTSLSLSTHTHTKPINSLVHILIDKSTYIACDAIWTWIFSFVALQAVIHLESIQSTPKQIEFLDSLINKFNAPNPDNPCAASFIDREELSSIFLEVW